MGYKHLADKGCLYMMDIFRLASIFGPILCILGLWVLFRSRDLEAIWRGIEKEPALLFTGGLFNLLIGFTVLSFYSGLSLDALLLISMLGYLSVLRAVLIFFAPTVVLSIGRSVSNSPYLWMMGFIPLAWGIALLYFRNCLLAI